jgi:hypothetical protein
LAWALCRLRLAVVGSSVPSTAPALTFWPTVTATVLMVPLVEKPTSSTVLGATLPLASTDDSTVPVVTVVVRALEACAVLWWKTDSTPKKINRAQTTTSTALTQTDRLFKLLRTLSTSPDVLEM